MGPLAYPYKVLLLCIVVGYLAGYRSTDARR